jgi:hypothetical protein
MRTTVPQSNYEEAADPREQREGIKTAVSDLMPFLMGSTAFERLGAG